MDSKLNNHGIMDLLFPANPNQFSLNTLSTPVATKQLVTDIKALIPAQRKIGVNDFYLFLAGNPPKLTIVKLLARSLTTANSAIAHELWDSYSESLQGELRPMLGTKCPGLQKVEKPPIKKEVPPARRLVVETRINRIHKPEKTIVSVSNRITPKAIRPASTFWGWNNDQKKRNEENRVPTVGIDVVVSRKQPRSYSIKRWSPVVMSFIEDPFQKYIAEIALEEPLELQVAGLGIFSWTEYVILAEETIVLQKAMEKLRAISSTTQVKPWPSEIKALKEMFKEHLDSFTKMPYVTSNGLLLQYFGAYVRAN